MPYGQLKDTAFEIYIHIPFCIKKCLYCDFLSAPASGEAVGRYVDALIKEIKAAGKQSGGRVSSVFVGGGTPTVLSEAHLTAIFDALHASFRLEEGAEITVEANPGTLTAGKARALKEAGVNRLSLGLQSVFLKDLRMLGRIHTFEDFLISLDHAQNAGFRNINADLMFALPGQTRKEWEQCLLRTAALPLTHISAYSLILEENTPLYRNHPPLPPEDDEYAMYEDTNDILSACGFTQYEISNYARNGFPCRHNLGYWKRVPYLGLGLGASSLWQETRYKNTSDMPSYLENAQDPQRLQQEKEYLTRRDAMSESMFLGLRLTQGVSKKAFQKDYGIAPEAIYAPIIKKYTETGLLNNQETHLSLTRKGIHVSNTIMAEFLL